MEKKSGKSGIYFGAVLFLAIIISISSTSFGDDQWISIGPEGGSITCLAINPQTPDTLYAGTSRRVFKSTDGGTNWIPVDIGLSGTQVTAIVINPHTPETLYAGTMASGTVGGLFKSTNGGISWTKMNEGTLSIWALAIDPLTPDTLYAGTQHIISGQPPSAGVLKSTNGGINWIAVNDGLSATQVNALAIGNSSGGF